jgi:hypothetical protein
VDYGFALALGPLGGVFVCGQCDRDPASSGIAYDYLAVKYAETTGIAEADVDRPGTLAARSAPNPFRGRAVISWETPEHLTGDLPSVAIYDVSGRLVRTLVHSRGAPGRETAAWDGTDRSGAVVSSGVYFCRISLGGEMTTTPIVFLR